MPVLRRSLAWVCCLCLALTLGCASKQDSPALTRIVDSGKLRVGMSGEQPPLNMTSKSGELFGMEVALMRVLAKSMGVEPVWVQRPFGQLFGALDAGEVDLVMSGVTITPARTTRVVFVGPYFTSGKAVLTKNPQLAAAAVPQDLDSPDLRVSALAGSTSEEFVRSSLPQVKLETTKTSEEAIRRVLDGKADALIADRETCAFAELRWPDEGLLTSEASFTVEPMGIAVPQNQPHLANLLQTYMNALQESGAMERAREFWFEDPSWVKDLK